MRRGRPCGIVYADASGSVGVSPAAIAKPLTCDTLNRKHGQRTDNEVTSTLDQVVISELVGINHNKADKFLLSHHPLSTYLI